MKSVLKEINLLLICSLTIIFVFGCYVYYKDTFTSDICNYSYSKCYSVKNLNSYMSYSRNISTNQKQNPHLNLNDVNNLTVNTLQQ